MSPKYVKKAYVSPCFQNGLQKSPLDFLGFPVFTAFSHKELMAIFSLRSVFTVKTTKCRQMVHTVHAAKGSQYPQMSRQQAASCDIFLIAPRGPILAVFSTHRFLTVLHGRG